MGRYGALGQKGNDWRQILLHPFQNDGINSPVSSGEPTILGDNLGDGDAPSPPPSPPPPPPPMTTDSNSPPPLGTEYYYPALDALQNMPHLSEQEKAHLLLLEILDGCPNCVYDNVVSHIESNIGSVYTIGVQLYNFKPKFV
jgi:hypothetical protein